MEQYFVNNQADNKGDHEVHKRSCAWTSQLTDATDLGYHPYSQSAVDKAKEIHATANGCFHCCNGCHTS